MTTTKVWVKRGGKLLKGKKVDNQNQGCPHSKSGAWVLLEGSEKAEFLLNLDLSFSRPGSIGVDEIKVLGEDLPLPKTYQVKSGKVRPRDSLGFEVWYTLRPPKLRLKYDIDPERHPNAQIDLVEVQEISPLDLENKRWLLDEYLETLRGRDLFPTKRQVRALRKKWGLPNQT